MGILPTKQLEKLIFSGIVFNMSWEDPYMDREALQIGPGDTCCTIVSGGCNVLSLLCWDPEKVYGVEQNAAQANLLELKMAALKTLGDDWKTFSDIFGAFDTSQFKRLYYEKFRGALQSDIARRYWDKSRNQRAVIKGLHRAGKNGVFLKILGAYLRTIFDRDEIERLFVLDDPAEVETYFEKTIAPRLFSTFIRRVTEVGKPYFWLAGVHPTQLAVVERDMPLFEYIKIRIRNLVTANLPKDNYFLASSVLAKFLTREAVPPYLQEKYWPNMTGNIDRLELRRGWLHEVLDSLPEGTVNKYSLLDIFDWMTEDIFENVLRSVIRAGRDGGLIVYRSGAVDLEPPAGVAAALPMSDEQARIAKEQLAKDLSGIYMCFKLRSIDKSKFDASHSTATPAAQPEPVGAAH